MTPRLPAKFVNRSHSHASWDDQALTRKDEINYHKTRAVYSHWFRAPTGRWFRNTNFGHWLCIVLRPYGRPELVFWSLGTLENGRELRGIGTEDAHLLGCCTRAHLQASIRANSTWSQRRTPRRTGNPQRGVTCWMCCHRDNIKGFYNLIIEGLISF